MTAKPPDFSEWTDFIGTVVLRWVTVAIAAIALRGLDQQYFTDADKEDITLGDEELEAVAKPFAHLAMRSAFLTKNGRLILDSKDAIEGAVILVMWMARVNRIGRKYRRAIREQEERNGGQAAFSSGENVPQGAAIPVESPAGGTIDEGIGPAFAGPNGHGGFN